MSVMQFHRPPPRPLSRVGADHKVRQAQEGTSLQEMASLITKRLRTAAEAWKHDASPGANGWDPTCNELSQSQMPDCPFKKDSCGHVDNGDVVRAKQQPTEQLQRT